MEIGNIVIDQMAKPVTKSHKAFDLDDEDLTFLALGVVAFIPSLWNQKNGKT